MLKFFNVFEYLLCSHIWLYLFMDDFHFGYIAKLNPKKPLTFTVHLNWVVLQMDIANAFNAIFQKTIIQKLFLR